MSPSYPQKTHLTQSFLPVYTKPARAILEGDMNEYLVGHDRKVCSRISSRLKSGLSIADAEEEDSDRSSEGGSEVTTSSELGDWSRPEIDVP